MLDAEVFQMLEFAILVLALAGLIDYTRELERGRRAGGAVVVWE